MYCIDESTITEETFTAITENGESKSVSRSGPMPSCLYFLLSDVKVPQWVEEVSYRVISPISKITKYRSVSNYLFTGIIGFPLMNILDLPPKTVCFLDQSGNVNLPFATLGPLPLCKEELIRKNAVIIYDSSILKSLKKIKMDQHLNGIASPFSRPPQISTQLCFLDEFSS